MPTDNENTKQVRSILHVQVGIDGVWDPTEADLDAVAALFKATESEPTDIVVTRNGINAKYVTESGNEGVSIPFHRTIQYLRSLSEIKTPDGVGTYEGCSRAVFACVVPGTEKPFDLVPSNDVNVRVRLGEGLYKSWQLEILLAFNKPDGAETAATEENLPALMHVPV